VLLCAFFGLLAVGVGNTLFTLNLPRGIKGERSKLKGTKFQYGVPASLLTNFYVRTYVGYLLIQCFVLVVSSATKIQNRESGNLKVYDSGFDGVDFLKLFVFGPVMVQGEHVIVGKAKKDNEKQQLLSLF
jgi:hypothetical protein